MSYRLTFTPEAKKEWKKLGHTVREQFKTKLEKRLINPRVPKDRLRGFTDVYKIKLRNAGFRLVYEVLDKKILILVLAIGKRDKNEAYDRAADRH